MCELLLRVRDRDSRTPAQRNAQAVAGDVIVVVEDGHQWGDMEVANSDWRIIQLPGLPAAAIAQSVAVRPDPREPQRIAVRRRECFDINDEWLRDVLSRAQVVQFTDAEAARFLALRRQRDNSLPVYVI